MPGRHWTDRQVSLLLVLALRERNVPQVTERSLQVTLTELAFYRACYEEANNMMEKVADLVDGDSGGL